MQFDTTKAKAGLRRSQIQNLEKVRLLAVEHLRALKTEQPEPVLDIAEQEDNIKIIEERICYLERAIEKGE